MNRPSQTSRFQEDSRRGFLKKASIADHWIYGSMGDWIRLLGKRIVKLDVKGFSRKENKFTKIGEGDLDFADVRKALIEINYHGWCAAEVVGKLNRLKEVSGNMKKVFAL